MGQQDDRGQAWPVPLNEEERLAQLTAYDILDTPPEDQFDDLTALATQIFGMPVSLISLIDDRRQWFKSCIGLDVRESGRESAFCGHAILSDEVLVVPDALEDARFRDNPLVLGDPHIRFYAGAPLVTGRGFRLGTLCVIDREPRAAGFGEREKAILDGLSRLAMREIELRGTARSRISLLESDAGNADSAKQKFLRLMSHELRTPLNAVIGLADLIEVRKSAGLEVDFADLAKDIGSSGRHMLSLIEGLLQYASVERGEILLDDRLVSMAEVVRTALPLVPGANERVTADIDGTEARLMCDPRFVAQALANVIDNAVKFSPDGAAVGLRAEISTSGEARFRIEDSGPGIDELQIDGVLDAFTKLESEMCRTSDGVGLGLAACRRYVELHGGRIGIEAREGGGTVVELAFPAYRVVHG